MQISKKTMLFSVYCKDLDKVGKRKKTNCRTVSIELSKKEVIIFILCYKKKKLEKYAKSKNKG